MNKNKKKKTGNINTYRIDFDLSVVMEAERFPVGVTAIAFGKRIQSEVASWADCRSCEVTWTGTEDENEMRPHKYEKDDEDELKPHKYERDQKRDDRCLECGLEEDDEIHEVKAPRPDDDDPDVRDARARDEYIKEDMTSEERRDNWRAAKAEIQRLRGILAEANDCSFRWVRTNDTETPQVNVGDWVRFYADWNMRIGKVEYIENDNTWGTKLKTDAGIVNLKSVLEVRALK